MKEGLKRTFRNDSIEDIYIYRNAYSGLRSGKKVAYLTERAGTLGSEVGTLVFQPHRHFKFSGALFTYSLYELQVNGAGACERKGSSSHFNP